MPKTTTTNHLNNKGVTSGIKTQYKVLEHKVAEPYKEALKL